MSFQSQLRLGPYDQPMGMIRCSKTKNWKSWDAHLEVSVRRGLFVGEISSGVESGTTRITFRASQSYQLRLILEPPVGTGEHTLYEDWLQHGPGRAFYRPVRGVRNGHAFVCPPTTINKDGFSGRPRLGGDGWVAEGYVLLVMDRGDIAAYVWASLATLGLRGNDQRIVQECIIAQLNGWGRKAGF